MRATFSKMDEMGEGQKFKRYIHEVDEALVRGNVKRLIVCSGQVYYDLAAYRDKHKITNCAIARVEQLSPFPYERFIDDLGLYPALNSVVWAQEEPMNAGPWFYTSKRIESSLRHLNYPNGINKPIYVGRDCNAATAVGDPRLHQQELNQLLNDAFDCSRTVHSYVEKYLPAC
eukprot:GHVS01088808.1.p1 GENE.GHVS01088808.1~~GHVS01088808.1.p1  ORF type:complete len:184 (+),score=4.24 GHVS01088808.1:35-553(+)